MKPFLYCDRDLLFIHAQHQISIGVSGPPELLQFLHGILKGHVPTQRQAAGYLDVMKQCLTLAVPSFDLEKKKKQ